MLSQKDIDQIRQLIKEETEPRFQSIETRLSSLEKRLSSFEKNSQKHFTSLEEKIDQILHYTKTTADEVIITQNKVDNHETRIKTLETNVFSSSA